MNPPGSVVRIVESSEKIQKQETITSAVNLNNEPVKCIMSVDYNTGNINFIQNDHNSEIKVMYLENNGIQKNLQNNIVVVGDENSMSQSIKKTEKNVEDVGTDVCSNIESRNIKILFYLLKNYNF
jgi:hypothetical protein